MTIISITRKFASLVVLLLRGAVAEAALELVLQRALGKAGCTPNLPTNIAPTKIA